ncbi:MAG: SHOCT domain-containing protein [Candidatus Dormibacteraeota bacterium]|nr:SHOCT domain-containing protein [Candidatus Dormibacteraeota bacterium]
MIAASMKGAGIDVNAVTQMQLAARQAGQGTPNMIVGGQLVGPGMQPVHPAAAAPASNVDQLSKLAELHKSGALSDEEFAAEKAKLLNS